MTENVAIEHGNKTPVEPDFDVDAATTKLLRLEERTLTLTGPLFAFGAAAAAGITVADIAAGNKEQGLRQQLNETPQQATVKTQAIQEQIKDAESNQVSDGVIEGLGGVALVLTTAFVAGLYQTRKLKNQFREAKLRVPTIWPTY